MNSTYPDPWSFSNSDNNLISPDGQYRVEYGSLSEIAMGAPIGGDCNLVLPNGKRLKLSNWSGGPAIWETNSKKLAFPVWTSRKDQQIAVYDIDHQTLTIYSKRFRVVNLKTFAGNLISGVDSPIFMTTEIQFDITKEEVKSIKQLT